MLIYCLVVLRMKLLFVTFFLLVFTYDAYALFEKECDTRLLFYDYFLFKAREQLFYYYDKHSDRLGISLEDDYLWVSDEEYIHDMSKMHLNLQERASRMHFVFGNITERIKNNDIPNEQLCISGHTAKGKLYNYIDLHRLFLINRDVQLLFHDVRLFNHYANNYKYPTYVRIMAQMEKNLHKRANRFHISYAAIRQFIQTIPETKWTSVIYPDLPLSWDSRSDEDEEE